MTPQQLREMLAQTLEDGQLSRSERSALRQILEHQQPGGPHLANFRHAAFDLARDVITPENSRRVLDWLEDVMRLLQPVATMSSPSNTAEALFSPGEECPRRIRALLQAAEQSIEICVFAITDDRLTSAILDAHRRGVRVRVITDDEKALDQGGDAGELADAGVDVRLDRSRYHMHHKFALFDRSLLLTGSYNWTRSAADSNEENFIVTGDPRFITPFANLFDRLWQQFAG